MIACRTPEPKLQGKHEGSGSSERGWKVLQQDKDIRFVSRPQKFNCPWKKNLVFAWNMGPGLTPRRSLNSVHFLHIGIAEKLCLAVYLTPYVLPLSDRISSTMDDEKKRGAIST
ncbi:hypothetical protein Ae201684P_003736 [Aphanomyces euteiches]|uniref:Uncharacterized protein n=1 Tax=Aphanomyces euteiches TaxID=100861 RepID=A0A6G0XT83_9STRA|nr:hypothetical protein Ae201684_001758 [Aphanomyces euteiches]KAH9075051.1 hypothetical protein Ae201684P_003736 [Aphanomyces euteiches]